MPRPCATAPLTAKLLLIQRRGATSMTTSFVPFCNRQTCGCAPPLNAKRSPEALRIFGYPVNGGEFSLEEFETPIVERERAHQALHDLIDTGQAYDLEYTIQPVDGSPQKMVDAIAKVETDMQGTPTLVVGFIQDITKRKQLEEEVQRLASHDVLTGLPNRRLLLERLSQTLAATKRSHHYGALVFLDLDNFKPLNDTHGHQVGDLLLIEVASRLKACVREIDVVARFGGDEFVVLLSDIGADPTTTVALASQMATKIRNKLAETYVLGNSRDPHDSSWVEHHCTASIGCVIFQNHEESVEGILKKADAAMYEAKVAGRNKVVFLQ